MARSSIELRNQTADVSIEDEEKRDLGEPILAPITTSPKGQSELNKSITAISGVSVDNEARPACFKSNFQEWLCIVAATIAAAEAAILVGVTSAVTSYIAADLQMTQAELTWINAAPNLAAGTFLMFFGSIADLFGRRMFLIASLSFFSICSIIIGFANSAIYMNVFCAFLGLCAAAGTPPAIGILGAAYPQQSKRKNRAFACFSSGNPLGFVVGAFLSGVCFQVSSWRTSFWALGVIYAIFAIIAFFVVPYDQQGKAPFNMETLKKFDYLGVLLAVAGLSLLISSLTVAGISANGWHTAYVIVMLILGVALIGAFLYWESIFSRPLMRLAIWKDKNFSLLIAILCLGFFGFSQISFWLGLFFQEVKGFTPLQVAIHLLPQVICGTSVNVVAGLIMHRVSNKILMFIGALGYVVCFVLLSVMDPDTDNWYWKYCLVALSVSVLGADFEFTITNMYVMSSMLPGEQASAGGIFNTVSRLSTSLGLGISTAAFNAISDTPGETSADFKPYRVVFWISLAMSVFGLCLVPFLTINLQGAKKAKKTGGS